MLSLPPGAAGARPSVFGRDQQYLAVISGIWLRSSAFIRIRRVGPHSEPSLHLTKDLSRAGEKFQEIGVRGPARIILRRGCGAHGNADTVPSQVRKRRTVLVE